MKIFQKALFFLSSLVFSSLSALEHGFGSGKDEETYSISLTQTAEPDVETEQEIRVVEKKQAFTLEGKKVVTETYTVKKGDHLGSS